MMKNEFVPYKESLELKGLGFDEQCMRFYSSKNGGTLVLSERISSMHNTQNSSVELEQYCSAPLYQQAFRWFRDIHNKNIIIETLMNNQGYRASIMISHPYQVINIDDRWDKWEGAELACLRELIKIVKHKLTE